MSFGSLKTLKLERTLGDAVLSITKQVPTDADEKIEFDLLDFSIINSANELREFKPEGIKAERAPSGYPTIGAAEVKEEAPKPEVVAEKPKKRAGRPVGSKGKPKPNVKAEPKAKPTLAPVKEEAPKKVPVAALATQDEKTDLVKKFQSTFESEIGFTSEDTYMTEFNDFMNSLISMTYEAFLEAEITAAQINTFKDLI